MAAAARSSSCPSLRVAGVEMSHIPKRASQHGVFLSSAEVLPPTLKPGQASLQRQVYAEEAQPLEETYLGPDMPFKSIYTRSQGSLRPEDFMDTAKPIRPTEPTGGGGHHGTAHWRSEYRSSLSEGAVAGARYYRQTGPSYQACNPPACISRAEEPTTYRDEFCSNLGLRAGGTATRSLRSVLAAGTPKGTLHIPGYQGFLPANIRNPRVAQVAMGEEFRSVDKTNISEQFHARMLGFSGHLPLHVNNLYKDTPNTKTVAARDFKAPLLNAFAA